VCFGITVFFSGKLTTNEFVAVTSTNAAKLFNIYPRKGLIAVGSDADIIVWDPAAKRTISKTTHWQKIDHNIFEGWTVTGVPAITVVAGNVAWEALITDGVADWRHGKWLGKQGTGRYVHRTTFGPAFDNLKAIDRTRERKPVDRS